MTDRDRIEKMLETFKTTKSYIPKTRIDEFISLCHSAIFSNQINTRDADRYGLELRMLPNVRWSHLPNDLLAKIRQPYSILRYGAQEKHRNLFTVYISSDVAHGKTLTLRGLAKRLNRRPGEPIDPISVGSQRTKSGTLTNLKRAGLEFSDVVIFDYVTPGSFVPLPIFMPMFDPDVRYGYTVNQKRYYFTPDYVGIAALPTVGDFISDYMSQSTASKRLLASKPNQPVVFRDSARDALINIAKRLPVHIRSVALDKKTGKSVYIVEQFIEDIARAQTGNITADNIQSWYAKLVEIPYTYPNTQQTVLNKLAENIEAWREARQH